MALRHPEKVKNPINPIKKKPSWIKTKIFKDCEHNIPVEGSSAGLEFLKKNLL